MMKKLTLVFGFQQIYSIQSVRIMILKGCDLQAGLTVELIKNRMTQ